MIDTASVLEAILACEASPLAKEDGARLVERYIEKYAEHDAATYRVVDVERAWTRWLDDFTLLVGCKDAKFEDNDGPLLLELKTHKDPQRTKAGEIYKGQGEEDWLQKMSTGIQLGVYALDELGEQETIRVMVRAVLKSTPVEFSPKRASDGIFIFNGTYLEYVKNALLVRAAEIRAARLSQLIPWDWMGYKCQRMYGKPCGMLDACTEKRFPEGRKQVFSATDPGGVGIEAALKEKGFSSDVNEIDPRVVILSASAYEDYSTCRERGRQIQDGLAPGDESMELQIGSVFHAGAAQMYRGLRDSRIANVS